FMYISASAPDAPPLSETTMGWLISLFFWIAACIMRAIWSDAPAAPAANTISTGLVVSHAIAGALASAIANAAAVVFPNLFIPSSSFGSWHWRPKILFGGAFSLPVLGKTTASAYHSPF